MRERPLIYLAGAIDNIPKWQALQWREEATEVLAKLGCDVYNPLTAVMAVGSPEEVIEQNERALRSSDAVLAELWFPALHYGTVCEVEAQPPHVNVWHKQSVLKSRGTGKS